MICCGRRSGGCLSPGRGSDAPEYSKSPKEAATRRTTGWPPFAGDAPNTGTFCWARRESGAFDRPVGTWLQVPGLLPFYPSQFFPKPNRRFWLL